MLNEKIIPFTLYREQQTGIGHKNSFTSSQAHGSLLKSLPLYLDDNDWITVATYFYGDNWRYKLSLNMVEDTNNDDTSMNNSQIISFVQFISSFQQENDQDISDNSESDKSDESGYSVYTKEKMIL